MKIHCDACEQDYEAAISSLTSPAFEDIGILMVAQEKHVAAHPDSLKTQGGPDPRLKRDWVGCRCRGACRCPRRRRGRA